MGIVLGAFIAFLSGWGFGYLNARVKWSRKCQDADEAMDLEYWIERGKRVSP